MDLVSGLWLQFAAVGLIAIRLWLQSADLGLRSVPGLELGSAADLGLRLVPGVGLRSAADLGLRSIPAVGFRSAADLGLRCGPQSVPGRELRSQVGSRCRPWAGCRSRPQVSASGWLRLARLDPQLSSPASSKPHALHAAINISYNASAADIDNKTSGPTLKWALIACVACECEPGM